MYKTADGKSCVCSYVQKGFQIKSFLSQILLNKLHTNLIDVFLELVEEVVPASDETTLVLVVDHFQLVTLPSFLDLGIEKRCQRMGLNEINNSTVG